MAIFSSVLVRLKPKRSLYSLEHESPGPDQSGGDQTGLVVGQTSLIPKKLKQFSKLIPTFLGTNLKFCPKQIGLVPTRPV